MVTLNRYTGEILHLRNYELIIIASLTHAVAEGVEGTDPEINYM